MTSKSPAGLPLRPQRLTVPQVTAGDSRGPVVSSTSGMAALYGEPEESTMDTDGWPAQCAGSRPPVVTGRAVVLIFRVVVTGLLPGIVTELDVNVPVLAVGRPV